jgi:hypothetical protein
MSPVHAYESIGSTSTWVQYDPRANMSEGDCNNYGADLSGWLQTSAYGVGYGGVCLLSDTVTASDGATNLRTVVTLDDECQHGMDEWGPVNDQILVFHLYVNYALKSYAYLDWNTITCNYTTFNFDTYNANIQSGDSIAAMVGFYINVGEQPSSWGYATCYAMFDSVDFQDKT